MSSAAKRPRGRPAIPRDVQRRRLLEAAWRAFERSRWERTTVADIVTEAGMSSRSFYLHFGSKEDLIAEMVEEVAARLLGEIEALLQQTPDDVEKHADAAIGCFLEMLPAASIDLERLGGDAGRRVGEVRRRMVQSLTDLTVRYMERMHALGRVPRAPDRAEIELLLTGIEGMCLRYYSEGRRDELIALRPRILRLMVAGLA